MYDLPPDWPATSGSVQWNTFFSLVYSTGPGPVGSQEDEAERHGGKSYWDMEQVQRLSVGQPSGATEEGLRANQIVSRRTDRTDSHALDTGNSPCVIQVTGTANDMLPSMLVWGGGSGRLNVHGVRYRITSPVWNPQCRRPCLHAQRSGWSSCRLTKFSSYCATLSWRLTAHPRTSRWQAEAVVWAFWPLVVLRSNRRSTKNGKVDPPPKKTKQQQQSTKNSY